MSRAEELVAHRLRERAGVTEESVEDQRPPDVAVGGVLGGEADAGQHLLAVAGRASRRALRPATALAAADAMAEASSHAPLATASAFCGNDLLPCKYHGWRYGTDGDLTFVPYDALPEDATHLLWLCYSLVNISFPVEVWRQPRVPDSGAASMGVVVEPAI